MPWKWFPETREKYPVRQIHFHMGPTNSGKTKTALDHLRRAKTGCYLSPLRLLALEVQEILAQSQKNESDIWEDGVVCNVKTGQIKKYFPNATHTSCTIEMTDYSAEYDCAVIDEIQMIEDANRGHHWTNAILGLKAKEIHLCGSEAALKIIVEILKNTGDELTIHKYARFSSLTTERAPMKSFDELEEGDCFISFSKGRIYDLKDRINEHLNEGTDSTQNHCAVLYGSLPAESKIKQAQYFN